MYKLNSESQHFKRVQVIGYLLIFLAIAIGLITRIIAVFQYVSFDIGQDPDQVRDAFVVINMWQGDLPTLGSQVATIGRHHILPLYYYLFFPFTILGADPVFQALPNALFSFLSIPLLIYLVYQLLEHIETPIRIFLSGLAGFWYSLLYGEIFISNFQWNPSSIPFFLLLFTLLYYLQMEGDFSLAVQMLLWVGYGVTLAILVSLHSSTLFVLPIVFMISCGVFIYQVVKQKRYLLISLPIVSILSAILALTPYWIGEFSRGFQNTKSIFKTIVTNDSQAGNSFLMNLGKKISNLFLNYFKLFQEAYLWNHSWIALVVSVIFLAIITYWGITKFKGNKYIWCIWLSTWGIYLYAASNLDSETTVFHYKLLIIFAPIILTITSLAYLNLSKQKNLIFYVITGMIITYSCLSNLFYDYQFMLSKYGNNRLINTADITKIINQLPDGAVICDPRVRGKRIANNQYKYIDTNITHKNISVVNVCVSGNYVIHPQRLLLIDGTILNDPSYEKITYVKFTPPEPVKLWPIFEIVQNRAIARPAKLVFTTDTANVYLLN
ncbi:hypothetical protein [Nostoc sp. TCL26-01]|uniref:hypothetical protein n=1 Tax=Nostoc sp. TCL26-01 TaxID=2576904 RepID=UPI0015BE72D7|nr:hypothetical protein [Nostoc sp. TCL26-01]QLE57272.1 hypothetical protein FD725_18130 [Nostoc sp. TCL26-01]